MCFIDFTGIVPVLCSNSLLLMYQFGTGCDKASRLVASVALASWVIGEGYGITVCPNGAVLEVVFHNRFSHISVSDEMS